MMKLGRPARRVTIITAVLTVIGLGLLLVTLPKVFAATGLTNDLPSNNNNFEAGGTDGGLDLHLKNLDVAHVYRNKFGAYYPASITSADNKSIKITKGKSPNRVCHIDSNVTGHIYVKITIDGQVTPDSGQYNIPMQQVCDSDQFYSHEFPFPNGNLMNNPGSQHNWAKIEVILVGTNELAASSGNDLNYTVSLTGGGASEGLLALTENRVEREFGLRSTYTDNPPANKNVRVGVPFGYRCSIDVNNAIERTLRLYDADAVFGETFMWIERDGQPLERDEYENYNNTNPPGTQQSAYGGRRNIVGMDQNQFDNNGKRWTMQGSNLDYNQLTIAQNAILRGHDYKLRIHNTGAGGSLTPHNNTLSVAIPQDGIYSELANACDYTLRPNISVSPDQYVYYPSLTVSSNISKSGVGSVQEQHAWQKFVVRYSSKPSTLSLRKDSVSDSTVPCSADVIPSGFIAGSCGVIANASYPAQPNPLSSPFTGGGPDPVGTHVCFFARIQNPTYREDDNSNWHYSDLVCSFSAKKPRVQFRGSDVRVGGNAISSYYKVQSNNYGSWAEYGMFTSGVNTLVSSGNSLRDGNPDDNVAAWNRLTFANTTSPYGTYGVVPTPSSAYTYFRNLPLSGGNFSQGNPTTGVYDVGSNATIANLTVNANGQSIILKGSGDMKIGNIVVRNEGVARASDLSQVVIVADSITFLNSADRADAWLVTSPTGFINTCGIGVTALTSGTCPNTLTVNGPVFTNRLMLRRTAGANPPTPADFAAPAERFNLRPDAQIWAYTYANKADYAQTDFVQELPPRY